MLTYFEFDIPDPDTNNEEIEILEEVYQTAKRKAIIQIINQEDADPVKYATTGETLKLKEYPFKKQFGQRYNWWIKGLES